MNEENPMVMSGDGITAARSAELDEPEMVVCPICKQEVLDEECLFGVCDTCLSKAETMENAIAYGSYHPAPVRIHGLYAKLFGDEIHVILRKAAMKYADEHPLAFKGVIHGFLTDDSSDFADWLIEREKR